MSSQLPDVSWRVRVGAFLSSATRISTIFLIVAIIARSRPLIGALAVITLGVSVPATLADAAGAISPARWFSIPPKLAPQFTHRLRRLSIRNAIFAFVCGVLSAVACVHAFFHLTT